MDKLSELKFINQQAYNQNRSKGFLSASLGFAIAILLILFVFVSAVLAYADISQPGSLLYPIKLFKEDAKIKLSQHPRDTAALYGTLLSERLTELEKISLNPSPVFDKKASVGVASTNDTVNEVIAGIFIGDLQFDATDATNQIETLASFEKVFGLISENTKDKALLDQMDELEVKVQHLATELTEISNLSKRRVQAFDN